MRSGKRGDRIVVCGLAEQIDRDNGARREAEPFRSSHGSLAASDSEVPMLTVGLRPPPASITGIKQLLIEHFGVGISRAA